jgi:hypothetical protein
VAIATVSGAFAPVFSRRVFAHGNRLMVGAGLAPGKRTITSVLPVMGRSDDAPFQHDPRGLNRARWLPLDAGHRRLGLRLDAFVPAGPVVMGIAETSERRGGEPIAAKGLDRDPGRSSHTPFVKARGRRWVSLRLLTHIPWAARVWALPFLTVLAPSARDDQARGRRPHARLDRARQAVRLVRRWLPTRELVVVGDQTDAALEWLEAVR